MIQKQPKRARSPHASVTCDDCGRTSDIACDYSRNPDGSHDVLIGQLMTKLQRSGWNATKKAQTCPDCVMNAKAKAQDERKKEEIQMTDKTTADAPTRMQNQAILTLLGEVYDVENGRYRKSESDKTVAEAIGDDVKAEWVAATRIAFFGEDGSNEDNSYLIQQISELEERLVKIDEDFRAMKAKHQQEVNKSLIEIERLIKMAEDLKARSRSGGALKVVKTA